MSVPAAAVPGPVLVIARSANRWTVVIAVAVLLAALVSSAGLLAVTVAEFVSTVPLAVFGGTRVAVLVIVPVVVGLTVTTIVIVVVAAAARLARVQVTVPLDWLHVQPAPAALTKVTPAGRVSVTVTLVAPVGPPLVTVSV